jgi:GntR family transcriptional regulator
VIELELNFNNSKSIYLQIIDGIKKRIAIKELLPGDKVMSQRDFAVIAKVNPNTVQRAYREMEAMNILETLRGQGTFVVKKEGLYDEIKKEMMDELITGFLSEMKSLGNSNDEILKQVKNKLSEKGGE